MRYPPGHAEQPAALGVWGDVVDLAPHDDKNIGRHIVCGLRRDASSAVGEDLVKVLVIQPGKTLPVGHSRCTRRYGDIDCFHVIEVSGS